MPVTLTELIDGRETRTGDSPSAAFHYVLEGTSDEQTAKNTKTLVRRARTGGASST